ncbi:hypothetical protein DFH11DRAFT_1565255, partial [Phellopilus nigrolimitatus]
MVSVMKQMESYADVGGLNQQIQEIKVRRRMLLMPFAGSGRASVHMPELYEEMGIRPPKVIILYGVPGTGKTFLAKAAASQMSAMFLRVVGSKLIQKSRRWAEADAQA